ncbi:adenosylcobinamide-GDP ribazoletransferase [Mesorhizobium sp. LHD-90]|uniref:adenosylcobinamide-GDP ribazoletransferase n=1 Tax=Mesorhizobium sp. LHD-90 TaxID=3071414 RepID=UPI0027E11102|nr:adenosylcobinamide-GDP ribazoletransferase [Mesorhizobium sp. LHD-90]MDQ6434421.1 adenosylcobinamide-GDP ribazoletransferase [Mesorhizobium sp. LHD-90]
MTSARNIVRDVGFCILFFTRLPLPDVRLEDRKLSEAIWAAPIAGWVVALIGGLAFWTAGGLGVPPGPAAALALAVTMLATGCLHEDGLSDTADGFGGGRNRERILDIMRDSRIGAFGASALGLSMLLRWSALAAIAASGAADAGAAPDAAAPASGAVFFALFAAHGGSRALLPAFIRLVPPARQDGLAAGAGDVEPAVAGAALMLGFLSLLVLGFAAALVTAVLLAATFFAFRALCLNKIGGQTGDTLGALQQAAEILILLIASAVF